MKRSRTLALTGALLLFLAVAPAVASPGIEAASSPGGATTSTRSEESPHREGPQLAAVLGTHRLVVLASRTHRRFAGAKLRALIPLALLVEPRAGAAGIDVEADARLLGASNTPCCVRGPPAAA